MDKLLKEEMFDAGNGLSLPVRLYDSGEDFYITIDDVEWCSTESQHHAMILFTMLKEHVTEYMTYVRRDK